MLPRCSAIYDDKCSNLVLISTCLFTGYRDSVFATLVWRILIMKPMQLTDQD